MSPPTRTTLHGPYSVPLVRAAGGLRGGAYGQTVLDVGCGPGALTAESSARLGPEPVAAVDPSEPFVAAARARHPASTWSRHPQSSSVPGRRVRRGAGPARRPLHGGSGCRLDRDGASDPARGIVAACVWDHAGGQGRSASSGRPPVSSIQGFTMNRISPAPAKATWRSCSGPRACARSRESCLREPRPRELRGVVGAVTAASARRAPSGSFAWSAGSSCASDAAASSPPPRSS